MYNFIENLNFFISFKLVSSEEIVIILLSYNFIKILIFNGLFELIWPTQFFNRRHTITNIKYRNFTEVLVKLINKNDYYNIFNFKNINYYFFNK